MTDGGALQITNGDAAVPVLRPAWRGDVVHRDLVTMLAE
jgi:hypothetical protein